MVVNMSLSAYTEIHTVLSVVALASGVVVVSGLLRSQRLRFWTALFLLTAIATSATGFGFPGTSFGASHWVGVFSLVALGFAVLARYVFGLAGAWRPIYAIGAVLALYFLFFVLVAQAFEKIPVLEPLAPTLSEPPFAVAQGVVLVVFAALLVVAARTFRPRVGFLARR